MKYEIQIAESFENPPERRHRLRVESSDDDYHVMWPIAVTNDKTMTEISWDEEPLGNKRKIEEQITKFVGALL